MKFLLVSCFFVFFLVPFCFSAKPSVKNALKHQVLIDLKNAIVPVIAAKVAHMKFPDIKSKSHGFEITVSNIQVSVATFHPNQIGIRFHPGTSATEISGTNFAMKGSAHIKAKWKILHKSFGADVTVSGAGMGMRFSIITNNGRLNIKIEQMAIHLSANHVHIHLHGDIIVKIIQFVINLLKGHLVNHLVKELNSKIPGHLTEIVNRMLNGLPRDLPIGNTQLMIRYEFSYAPAHRADYMTTGIFAYVYYKPSPSPPPYEPVELPEINPSLPRGIQLFFAEYVFQSSLDAGFKAGLMKLSFKKNLLGHDIKLDGKAMATPVFKLPSAIWTDMQTYADVVIDNNPNQLIQITSTIHFNCDEYIKSNIIFFHINAGEIKSIQYIVPKPFDIEWFRQGVNELLKIIIEMVNADLGDKGIPLPTMKEIEFRDLTQNIKNGYIELGFNPVFHIKSPSPEEGEVVAEEAATEEMIEPM